MATLTRSDTTNMFKQQLDEKKERAINLKDQRAKRIHESFQRKKESADVLDEARNMFKPMPKAAVAPAPPNNLSHQTSLLRDIGSAFGVLSNLKGSFKGSFRSTHSAESLESPAPKRKATRPAVAKKRPAEEEPSTHPSNESTLLFSSFFFDAATELRVEKIRQEGRARRPRQEETSSRTLHNSQSSLGRSGAISVSNSNASLNSNAPRKTSPSAPVRIDRMRSNNDGDVDVVTGSCHADPPRLELTVPLQPVMSATQAPARIKPMPMLQEEKESPAISCRKPAFDVSMLKTLVMAA